jgi:hypothetical protein
MKNRQNQQGNILFLILIAVALFAALSYVVTSRNRSGGGNSSKEKAGMLASDFMNYGVQMRTGIQRMMINNGCAAEEINYSHSYFGTYFDNPNAPPDESCNIFSPRGGDVPFRLIEVSPGFQAVPQLVGNLRVEGLGSDEPELALILFMQEDASDTKVNQEVCRYIFQKNGINVSLSSADTVPGGIVFRGVYASAASAGIIGDQVPELSGKDIGCFAGGPNQWWNMYVVLLER